MTDGRNQSVWLNDVSLTTVHPSIIVQHISEGELEYNLNAIARPDYGMFVARNVPQKREITIEFAIRERLNYATRAEAFQAVCAWAADGGWLTLSDHPGQQIYVTCTKMPSLGRLREWNENLTVVFSAIQYPFWIAEYPSTKVLEGVTTGQTEISVTGTRKTCLECDITPVSDPLRNVMLLANGTSMNFNLTRNLIPAGSTLRMFYDDMHYLRLIYNGTGMLQYRSGSDDIVLNPGAINNIVYSFNTPCNVTFMARGVWT